MKTWSTMIGTFAAAIVASTFAVEGDSSASRKLSTKDNQDLAIKASKDPNQSTWSQAAQTAGLDQTLKGQGPYTVFAPTDQAFKDLPKGVVPALMEEKHRDVLTDLVKYHVVQGEWDQATLKKKIEAAPKGRFELDTLEGERLSISEKDGSLVVTDRQGGKSKIVNGDLFAKNGVTHEIDRVARPEKLARRKPMAEGSRAGR